MLLTLSEGRSGRNGLLETQPRASAMPRPLSDSDGFSVTSMAKVFPPNGRTLS
jgi:hypothetical protein